MNKTIKKIKIIRFLDKFKKPIYEFYVFNGNQIMVDRDLKKMQEEGWELAGEISTKYCELGGDRMIIPLKRRIN